MKRFLFLRPLLRLLRATERAALALERIQALLEARMLTEGLVVAPMGDQEIEAFILTDERIATEAERREAWETATGKTLDPWETPPDDYEPGN